MSVRAVINDDGLACVSIDCPNLGKAEPLVWVPDTYVALGDDEPDPEHDPWNGDAWCRECV